MKRIAILGITGSIGTSAVEVIRQHSSQFEIVFATANNNFNELFQITQSLNIPQIAISNDELKSKIADIPDQTKLHFGKKAILEFISTRKCDLVLNAVSGSAGLEYSLSTIENDIDLALANKESLVMAGHLIESLLNKSTSRLIPVDSEHSAILQAVSSRSLDQVDSVILTASGGPFRTLPLSEFWKINIEQTLQHPTWKMGKKITIDSATMMNKALEVIEAHWLFKKKFSRIKTIIHPQSIIHSFVEFIDGSIIAQMGFPTMKLPILFAFTYPDHIVSEVARSNIFQIPDLTFSEVERDRFPLFFFAREIGEMGGLLPTIMNSANEAAISLFLQKKIGFQQIYKIVEYFTQHEKNSPFPGLDEILRTNHKIYNKVFKDYQKISG